jgi:hypothetical protein
MTNIGAALIVAAIKSPVVHTAKIIVSTFFLPILSPKNPHIILPVALWKRRNRESDHKHSPFKLRYLIYFSLLGIAFLFIEIPLIQRFKSHLADKVTDVRMTDRLSDSPARLVDTEGAPNQEMQRVYRLLKEDFQAPKKVLELNPHHPIMIQLNSLPPEAELSQWIIDQV